MDPGLIKGFEKRYGVRVSESNFDSMQGMMAKLRAGNRYDVIFPTAEFAQRLIKGNQLRQIDLAAQQHRITIFTDLRRPLVRPGAAHTCPTGSTRRGSASGRTRSQA